MGLVELSYEGSVRWVDSTGPDRYRRCFFSFFFQAEDGIRDPLVTGVQTCALPISFVALHHDVAFTPAAWVLDTNGTRPQRHERRGLLLVADPVYQADDPRLMAVQRVAVTPQVPDGRALDPARRG